MSWQSRRVPATLRRTSAVLREMHPTRRYTLAFGYACLVLVTSVVPATGTTPISGPFGLVGLDKWVHLGSYALVALLFAYAAVARSRRALLVVLALTALYGGGIELLQSLVPTRSLDPLDALANTAGAGVGVALWASARRFAQPSTAIGRFLVNDE